VSSFIKTVFPRPVPADEEISVHGNFSSEDGRRNSRTCDHAQSGVVVRDLLRYLEA
jgi:hypothetical protein